jgi:predicted MFS family arabinose efflux permease
MSLAAFVLVASEFMPVSLLTPIAADLHVTEGQAGQGISVSGLFALFTSLLIASVAARVDRKPLLLSLTLLMILSGTVVVFAPNYWVFMTGRALIGVAIGGFWSFRRQPPCAWCLMTRSFAQWPSSTAATLWRRLLQRHWAVFSAP